MDAVKTVPPPEPRAMLRSLGGEDGCRRLSREFYARVAEDPLLRPLFPGKSLRCAIEAFAAFLIQFLGGDEQQTQSRWWLSLRESHARFHIGAAHRSAWLKQMRAALDAVALPADIRHALHRFFSHTSQYVIGGETLGLPEENEELAIRWKGQQTLDDAVAAIAGGHDVQAIALASQFASRPTVFVGLLARMMKTSRSGLVRFVRNSVERDPALGSARFNGRTLLHHAAGSGCIEVVELVLKQGIDPDIPDSGSHTALYRVANECATEASPELVRMLVRAGADVDARGGVTCATALHMAARRGHLEIARALIEAGAALNIRDKKGATPLQRAINCRRKDVAQLLRNQAATTWRRHSRLAP